MVEQSLDDVLRSQWLECALTEDARSRRRACPEAEQAEAKKGRGPMASQEPPELEASQHEPAPDESAPRHAVRKRADPPVVPLALPPRLAPLVAFWSKINNDWIFNLAGLLAYNFLLTLFPILLLLLGGVGVLLGSISHPAQQEFEAAIGALLPGQTGPAIVDGIVSHLTTSVSLLLLIGFFGAFLAGSHLFITLENCFGIIFRLRSRTLLQQNLMALGMLLLYLIFVPVVFLGSLLPPLLRNLLPHSGHGALAQAIITVAYPLDALLVTTLAVGLTYAFVPNRPRPWRTLRENWKGATVAAALLLLYQVFFPWYTTHFVHVGNYGSVGAFAIIILLFFYFLGVILLLGAEINSWLAGQRETASDLPGILHAVQAHRSLRGAAGPTAGMPPEEMQHHQLSRWSRRVATLWRRLQRTHLLQRVPSGSVDAPDGHERSAGDGGHSSQ
jgi:membrane protein